MNQKWYIYYARQDGWFEPKDNSGNWTITLPCDRFGPFDSIDTAARFHSINNPDRVPHFSRED